MSLAGILGNNSIGYWHKLGKVDRAIKRTSNRLLNKVFTKKTARYMVELQDNRFLEVIWGTPDICRLESCFDRIVRGLHVHHFGGKFIGTTKVHLGYLHHGDKNAATFNRFIEDKVALELAGKEEHGNNRDVFFYQVTVPDQFGLFLIRMCFYGGLNVYTALLPIGSRPPSNLVGELIAGGIKTHIALNGTTYEFN